MQNNLSLQEAFPGKVVANHMVNANAVTEAFMNMSKPFMNKELASKVRDMCKLKTTRREDKCLRMRVVFSGSAWLLCIMQQTFLLNKLRVRVFLRQLPNDSAFRGREFKSSIPCSHDGFKRLQKVN